jgi:hypothetical protein
MALTNATLVEKARRRLRELGETIEGDLESYIPEALTKLGDKTAEDPNPRVRALAQGDFNVAMVAGAASLAAQPTILRSHILRVTHPTHGVMQHAETRGYLESEKSNLFFWWALENDTILARYGDGVTLSDDATVIVRSSFTPTFSTLHVQLEDDLVDVLLDLAREGVPAAAA